MMNQVERLDYVVPARTEEERQDDTDMPEAEVRRTGGSVRCGLRVWRPIFPLP